MTPDSFRAAIGHFASGVTVVSAATGSRRFGATVSAVSSLSLEPAMLLVCLNRQTGTAAAITRAGFFGVNVLAENQAHLAARFAGRAVGKFDDVPVTPGHHGQPLLTGALAHYECRVAEQVQAGTHTVFIGEVHHAAAREGKPLAYFRGRFGTLNLENHRAPDDELAARIARYSIGDWPVT
ncbi:flavin reductase family protein [Amycolatopsis ultiminotia]|uniref:flavin reductase family protein n=1 Tax=Amycolatopsis ultiminotia TaxID=543629 RepID=UPI0031E9013A